MVQKPTSPSAVGTIDGSSRLRCWIRESGAEHAGGHGRQSAHRDHHRLVDRDVDDLPAAAPGGAPGGGGGDRGGVRAGQPLAEPAARLDRFVVRRAPAGGRTAQCLQDEFVGGNLVFDVGARQPERRHHHDHRRRAGVRRDVRERPTVGQVGEHDVGAGQQRCDLRLFAKGHRPLTRREILEQGPGRPLGAPGPYRITLG